MAWQCKHGLSHFLKSYTHLTKASFPSVQIITYIHKQVTIHASCKVDPGQVYLLKFIQINAKQFFQVDYMSTYLWSYNMQYGRVRERIKFHTSALFQLIRGITHLMFE